MSRDRLKNIGITSEVWKELKLMTVEQECTMDEAVAELLKIAREQAEIGKNQPARKPRKKPGNEPG